MVTMMKCNAGNKCQNDGRINRLYGLSFVSESTGDVYCSVWCANQVEGFRVKLDTKAVD